MQVDNYASRHVDDLIADLFNLNERIYQLNKDAEKATDDDTRAVLERSYQRLDVKRDNLLLALVEALEYLRV